MNALTLDEFEALLRTAHAAGESGMPFEEYFAWIVGQSETNFKELEKGLEDLGLKKNKTKQP